MVPPQAPRTSPASAAADDASRSSTPLQGATPAARRSRFRGVPRLGGVLALFALCCSVVSAAGPSQGARAPSGGSELHAVSERGGNLQPKVEPAKAGTTCVADPAFMRRNHMKMLKHQRDDTLRGGNRQGQFSLKECIACHANEKTHSVTGEGNFCQSCHAYAAVSIDCFECHASQTAQKP